MNKHRIKISDLVPIDVWVTTNIAVYRQSTMWATIDKVYQFVPARPKGYVILTKANEKMHCRQLQGYTLYRPSSLTISWLADKVLNFRELTFMEGLLWDIKHQGRWKIVGENHSDNDEWGQIPL